MLSCDVFQHVPLDIQKEMFLVGRLVGVHRSHKVVYHSYCMLHYTRVRCRLVPAVLVSGAEPL